MQQKLQKLFYITDFFNHRQWRRAAQVTLAGGYTRAMFTRDRTEWSRFPAIPYSPPSPQKKRRIYIKEITLVHS